MDFSTGRGIWNALGLRFLDFIINAFRCSSAGQSFRRESLPRVFFARSLADALRTGRCRLTTGPCRSQPHSGHRRKNRQSSRRAHARQPRPPAFGARRATPTTGLKMPHGLIGAGERPCSASATLCHCCQSFSVWRASTSDFPSASTHYQPRACRPHGHSHRRRFLTVARHLNLTMQPRRGGLFQVGERHDCILRPAVGLILRPDSRLPSESAANSRATAASCGADKSLFLRVVMAGFLQGDEPSKIIGWRQVAPAQLKLAHSLLCFFMNILSYYICSILIQPC